MDGFQFHAELFEVRTEVIELLADAGYDWLTEYGSVDLLHDVYGVEVCGIRDKSAAVAIDKLLRKKFPKWRHGRMYRKDAATREPGWKVILSRDPEDFGDRRKVG